MAKKRKASGRIESSGPNKFKESDSKLAITTYKDVADSEDEFHISRDKILLDEGPDAKRRRKYEEEDAFLEPSDEEVLGHSEESEENDDLDDEEEEARPRTTKRAGSQEEVEDESEEEEEGWGSAKRDYYNADMIETEADALEEEAEARRLQQKKLQKMSEADFGFDESEWLDAGNEGEDDGVVTEVLKDIEITAEMGPEERLRILQNRYPEFEFLANEFIQLQPVLQGLQKQVEEEKVSRKSLTNAVSPTMAKARALAAYIAALAMYFALLTSPARVGDQSRTLDPAELRDHPIMDSLLQCRELWSKIKSLTVTTIAQELSEDGSIREIDKSEVDSGLAEIQAASYKTKKSQKDTSRSAAASAAAALRAERIQKAEEDLADISNLLPKLRKQTKKTAKAVLAVDDDSDFGEEETMDAKAAAEKASKKKSLRFYTSQIAQKANRRADAGRDAGGDADLPYRERLKDRQQRLNAEAEARGKKLDQYGRGTALGGEDSNDEDDTVAQNVRDGEDQYYDMVAQTSKKRKSDKDAKYQAIAAAKAEGKMVRIVEGEVDADGKRAIGYVIQKNKGLAPKRSKDVRNPRVKKRKKYEEKKKKLSSQRAVYKGGEGRGGYGGELTGIKTGLVKSVKL